MAHSPPPATLITASEWAVDLANVDKVYKGKIHALRGIEMRVRRGEIFGLLGPNGAGKSTLVKILMTVISPTKAEGLMLGRPVGHKPTLARVGYLPEHHRFPEYLTGGQVLDFYGALCGVPKALRRTRAAELLGLVGMSDWSKTKVKQYSKGMRQRIGIAQALMNDPDLVVLDEPTDGVDPVGRKEIRNVLTHIKERGKTVFLNSHLLSELEMVCDRVAILVQGKVKSQGTIDELTVDQRRCEIEIADAPEAALTTLAAALPVGSVVAESPSPSPPTSMPPGALATAPGRSGREASLATVRTSRGRLASGESFEIDRSTLRITTDDPVVAMPVLDALRAKGIVIRSFRTVRPSLEDLFMEAVTDPTTGQALGPGAARDPKRGAN